MKEMKERNLHAINKGKKEEQEKEYERNKKKRKRTTIKRQGRKECKFKMK